MAEAADIFNVHKKDKKLFAGFVPPADKGETFANIFENQPESVINQTNFGKISKKIHEKNAVVNLSEEKSVDEIMDPIDTQSHDAEMTPVEEPILVPIISELFFEIDAFKNNMNAPAESEIFKKILKQKNFADIKNQYIKVTLQYFLKLFKIEDCEHEFFQATPNALFMFDCKALLLKPIVKSLGNGLWLTKDAEPRTFTPKRHDALGKFFIAYSKKVNLPEAPLLSSLDDRKRTLVLHMFDYFYSE